MKLKVQTIIFVVIILSAIGHTGCTKTGDYSTLPKGRIPDQEIWNAVITVTRNGKPDSRIFASHMVQYPNSNEMIISDSMRIDFYRDGKHESYLTADSGMVNDKTEDIVAIGNVVMVSDSGFTAYTDSLFWLNDSDKVYTNSAIQIYSEEDTLYGTNFVSDVKFENWTIFNPLGKTRRQLDE
jgi:LPS export ABC transporter protein LptC